MTKDTLSLREAQKLTQFAPQTLRKKIESGEIKAKVTGKGIKKRYTIARKDLPKIKSKKVKPIFAKASKKVTLDRVTWCSQPFDPADLSPAETMLRTLFLQWLTEKLLAK